MNTGVSGLTPISLWPFWAAPPKMDGQCFLCGSDIFHYSFLRQYSELRKDSGSLAPKKLSMSWPRES